MTRFSRRSLAAMAVASSALDQRHRWGPLAQLDQLARAPRDQPDQQARLGTRELWEPPA